MSSMAHAYQFDPHDRRYYQCCCTARIHVSQLAKAVAALCIFSNIINAWNGVMSGSNALTSILVSMFGCGIFAVATFQEHRPTLILLLVLQGLGIAFICLALALIFIAFVILHKEMPRQFAEHGALFIVITVFQLALFFWSFAVMLHFYAFLTDRERAQSVPVMYQTRNVQQHQQQHQPAPRGMSRNYGDQRKASAARPANEDHISYPIYPVHRTPSITPVGPPPIASAPVTVSEVSEDQPPPPYESLEEKDETQ